MSEDLKRLQVEQATAIDLLKQTLINFKKLPKTSVTLSRSTGRLSDLRETWSKIQELHNKICLLVTEEEKKTLSYFVKEEFYAAEDVYHDAADHLRETISKFAIPELPTIHNNTETSIRDTTHGVSLQLPRIPLPKFIGDHLDWENFRNTFEALVATNDALTNTQKFHYLKSSVTGDAATLISNLKISDANYESAWQLLLDEYDDKQTLIHAHIHSFVNLPSMKTENVNELRKLRDIVSASLAALKNLERPVDQWDDLLVYLISQKLSQRTRNEWNLKRTASASKFPSYKDSTSS
ncbi:hypothetical protein RF55_12949 [Lasius niger]|uniref:Uncharacterized protein n=1 Tax=Lasius niger TaxID=67767 RepID=A0A0J7KBN4_LASNI|nr:hypothetical protein RF55_12949 [Lasius niger]